MRTRFKNRLIVSLGLGLMLLAAIGCQPAATPTSEPDSNSGTAAQPRQSPVAQPGSVVTGTVSYRERIALPPSAVVEVELRDVSLQDVSSTLIARQTITNPGQAPIPFRIEYATEAIESSNTYAVQARITYADGTLAFISDTAYEVITFGRPDNVDMVLVLVSAPSAGTGEPGTGGEEWVETQSPITAVMVEASESGYVLSLIYTLPGGAECAQHSSVVADRVGTSINATVNHLERRISDGSLACTPSPRIETTDLFIEGPFTPGDTHHVRVNGRVTNAFTPPRDHLADSIIDVSPVEEAELVILEIFPPQYQVRVITGFPRGSGCSQFNGYDIAHPAPNHINVLVTHHEIADLNVGCIADYPTVETSVPLGGDFVSGQEYMVVINGQSLTFTAQ